MINMPSFTTPAQAGGRPATLALVSASIVSPIGINIILPSMSSMQREFSSNYGTVQLTLSLFLASVAATQIIVGPLSDRFGRRPILLGGMAIFVAASLLAVVAPNVESLIGIRILQGAGGCTGIVLGRAIIRDVYDRRKAASMIGYVTMAYALGPMVAPMLGGYLQEMFGWRAQFYFLAAIGAVAFAVSWHWIGETNATPTARISFGTMFRDFGMLVSDRMFMLFTLVSATGAGIYFSFLGGASYISDTLLSLRPTEFGLWFMLVSLGYSLGNFVSGRYAERIGVRWMMFAGSLAAMIAITGITVGFWLGHGSAVMLFTGMLVIAVSNGLVLPSAIAGAISVRPDIAGAASGLSGAMQMATGAVCSTIAGAIIAGQTTALPVLTLMAACGALSFAGALLVQRISP